MNKFRGVLLGLLSIGLALTPSAAHAQLLAAPPAALPSHKSAADAGLTPQALRGALAPHVKGLAIDENQIRNHVIRPQHIVGVLSDRGREEGKLQITPRKPLAPAPAHHLDVDAFGQALHAAMKDQVAGYVMRMRKNGQTIYTLQWNWAKTPQDGNMG